MNKILFSILILLNIIFLFSAFVYNFLAIIIFGKPWIWSVEEIGHICILVICNIAGISIVRRKMSNV